MKNSDYELKSRGKNLYIIAVSILVGIFAGILSSAYRWLLALAEDKGQEIYRFAALHKAYLWLVFPALLLLAGIITWIIKKWPMSSGSGIPQVKGQLLGYFELDWKSTAFAKFIAGSLAMFAGLSLGREGPSIQLGASMGQAVAGKFAKSKKQREVFIAAGAAAGLSTAFNAPLSGTMFVLEEVYKFFSPIILLSCMTAAVVADTVSQLFFGTASIFHFKIVSSIALKDFWLLLLLGVILGVFGAIYNWALVTGQHLMKKIKSTYIRVAISFLVAGIMAQIFPLVIGSGHSLMESFGFGMSLDLLALILIGKFFISIVSYVSGVPGGIFFPLLVLGASIGALFATFSIQYLGIPQAYFANLVILAMAGCFTAIVRAPITGILLLVEMTGSFTHLLPLSLVSLIAYVTADMLKSAPIYDSLLKGMILDNKRQILSDNHDKKR